MKMGIRKFWFYGLVTVYFLWKSNFVSCENIKYKKNFNFRDVCQKYKRIDILPPKNQVKKTIFFIVGAFEGFPDEDSKKWLGVALRETFKYHLKRLVEQKNSKLQYGGILYETQCFERGLPEIVLNLILTKILTEQKYKIASIFTNAARYEFQIAENLLIPYQIPFFDLTKNMRANYNHQPFVKVPTKRNLLSLQKKIFDIQKSFKMNEMNFLIDSYLTTKEEDSARTVIRIKEGLKKRNVCFLMKTAIPKNKIEEARFNQTIQYSDIASTFIIYSRSRDKVGRVINLVHSIIGNRTFNWIVMSHIKAEDVPDSVFRHSNIFYLHAYQMRSQFNNKGFNYSDGLILGQKVISNPWLKASTKPKYNDFSIAQFFKNKKRGVRTSVQQYDIIIYDIFLIIKDIFKSVKSTHEKLKINKVYSLISRKHFLGYMTSVKKLYPIYDNTVIVKVGNRKRLKVNHKNVQNTCSGLCERGFGPVLVNAMLPCCWRCMKCPLGSIKTNQTRDCQRCPTNTMSNYNRTQCLPYVRKPLQFTPQTYHLSIIFSSIGSLMCLTLLVIFWYNRKTPLIKSSDTILMFPHLISHTVLFTMLGLSVVPSNQGICYTRAFATGILWTLSSSLTFVKTQKFLLIFQSRIRLTQGEMKRAKYYEIGSVLISLAVQISLLLLTIVYHGEIYQIQKDDQKIIEYFSCALYPYKIVIFSYVQFLLFICLIQSYRARHLPNNYNETKFITVSVLVTQVFILSYLIRGGELATELVLMGLANSSMVLIMYGYKARIVLFHPELNDARIFKKQLFEMASREIAESTT
ncbi:G-protein coupled receptor family C group 6 member A-like [Clytia hemisphaerica]|uniref:G-protein coupled receptor family C group 6 member A-like n=1 Tax=Clytia hemisphaerica TaxID=252671 RepID=UPI0034D57AF9